MSGSKRTLGKQDSEAETLHHRGLCHVDQSDHTLDLKSSSALCCMSMAYLQTDQVALNYTECFMLLMQRLSLPKGSFTCVEKPLDVF